ncbi:hypothetical protein [Streptomyces sp. NPDC005004]
MGRNRVRRRGRKAVIAAALTAAVSLTASGCVVVHGERAMIPAATRTDAAKALARFTEAYNKADRAYDSSLDEDHVTGALADIDSARLRAGHANHPDGNPAHTPLKLTDAKFTIPKKPGWPRWFVADALGNKGGSARWLLVFTRQSMGAPWQVAYLTVLAPGAVPKFKTDADGFAEAVPADATGLAVPPAELSGTYAAYLKSGGTSFANGPSTSGLRTVRQQQARKPGLVRQYIDETLDRGAYAPLALRTEDGGALVFFASRYYEKQTAAAGTSVPVPNQDVRALTKGEVRQSLTMEFVSNETALVPAGSGRVSVLGRVQGLTSARGA